MSREIKFRAWIKNKKKMVYGKDATSSAHFTDSFKYRKNEVELMQYTGLKDKNGVEIYEGDIIVGTYKDMGIDTGSVVFKGCGFKVEIPNVGDDELVDWERYSDSIEVIGNIYENPELLEGEK
jgi:uncharacterized phage protein (TIGR01671 family)